jgi:DNA-binding MarR family transcriptional regulator
VADLGARRTRRPAHRSTAPAKAAAASVETSHQAATADRDELLYHRLRLGMLSALAATDSLTFVDLRGLLGATDGNLSVHARKLEDAGYVTCAKSFADRRPRSEYRLAAPGRRALERHLQHMQALIEATRRSLDR